MANEDFNNNQGSGMGGASGSGSSGFGNSGDLDGSADNAASPIALQYRVGATGIERAWESYLRGTRGWEKVLVDAKGKKRPARADILGTEIRVDPIPGRDLRLTIDADLQVERLPLPARRLDDSTSRVRRGR